MWLVFWVISNVATGFYSLDLAPAFYKWGYAWPLHNRKQSSISPQPVANLNRDSCRSIAPIALRPTLAHGSQCWCSGGLVCCQLGAFCAGVLFDALGAAEGREEGSKERERVDECYVEAEE